MSFIATSIESSESKLSASYIFTGDSFITLPIHRTDRLCSSGKATFFHERIHKTEVYESALLENRAIALAPTSIEKVPDECFSIWNTHLLNFFLHKTDHLFTSSRKIVKLQMHCFYNILCNFAFILNLDNLWQNLF